MLVALVLSNKVLCAISQLTCTILTLRYLIAALRSLIYHGLFNHFPINIHPDCFQDFFFLTITNDAAINSVHLCLFILAFSFLVDIFPEVGVLGHSLNFQKYQQLIFRDVMIIYSPPPMVFERTGFLTLSPTLDVTRIFRFCQSDG